MSMQNSSVFNTSHLMDNEIAKANDFEFAFEQVVQNVSKATQMMLESRQDFIINGKVLPYSGMNVVVSPIYGVCKSTGVPFGCTEESDPMGFERSTLGCVAIIEAKGEWEGYDNQQRAFNDPDTDVQTYQYVDTKKRMVPLYTVKYGIEGAMAAPPVDEGYVKIAEVVIRPNADTILESDIKNVTADIAGLANEGWTTEPAITYNIGYISDVNARFRVQHNADGTHKDDAINSDSLDIGTGTKQINGNVLPIGASIAIPSQTAVSATDSIFSVITKAVAVITAIYNDYLKYGDYCFKGAVSVSAIADGNNALTKPLTFSAAGDGTAAIKIDGATVLSIDANGKLSTNGYAASSANHIVTKAVTDALQTALSSLSTRVTNVENSIRTSEEYANGALSMGSVANGARYEIDTTNILAATTANITLSGSQTIDGVSVTAGSLVLVKNQTDKTENGIYQCSASAWSRVNAFLTPQSLKGKLFTVQDGTANGKKMFYLTKFDFADSFGSDDIEFFEHMGAQLPAPNKFALRDSSGCVKTGEPNNNDDAVSKIYISPIVVSTDSKTVSGPALKSNMSVKILFTSAITGSDTTTPLSLTYNGTPVTVKVNKNGALADLTAHEVSSGTYKYLQGYTTLEMIYNGGYFVVVGNPIVLSSNDYTIYADGYIYEKKRSILKWNATPGNYGTGVNFIDFIAPPDGSIWLAHLYLSATGFNTSLAWLAVQNGFETEYFRCDSNDPDSTQVSATYFLYANSHLTVKCINSSDVSLERASVQYVKLI